MRYLLLPLLVLVAGCQADQSLPIPQGKPLAPAQPSQAELQEIAWRTHAIELLRGEDTVAHDLAFHTQIAEARIAYGGEGQITDVQQPRYGQQVADAIMPF